MDHLAPYFISFFVAVGGFRIWLGFAFPRRANHHDPEAGSSQKDRSS